jgi:hypothetical protein
MVQSMQHLKLAIDDKTVGHMWPENSADSIAAVSPASLVQATIAKDRALTACSPLPRERAPRRHLWTRLRFSWMFLAGVLGWCSRQVFSAGVLA